MRRIPFLIVGLLAASAALAPAASAHDYHRSKRAVEAPHARPHHAAPHRYVHRHFRAHHRHGHGPVQRHVKRHVHRHYVAPRYRPSFVIVISPDGFYRIARR